MPTAQASGTSPRRQPTAEDYRRIRQSELVRLYLRPRSLLRRRGARFYRVIMPKVIEVVKSWPASEFNANEHLRRQVRPVFAGTVQWSAQLARENVGVGLLGTLVAVVGAIGGLAMALRDIADVSPISVVISVIISFLTTLLLIAYVWGSPRSWLKGLATTAGILAIAGLVRLPVLRTDDYFSSIDTQYNSIDRVFGVLLFEGITFGYVLVVLALPSLGLRRTPNRIEYEVLRRAFLLFEALPIARNPRILVTTKRQIIRRLDDLAEGLSSRAMLKALRTGSIDADAVVFKRIRECAQLLRELQVWVALPRMDTIALVRQHVIVLVAVITVGAYDYLPRARGEIPPVSGRARAAVAVARVFAAIVPIGVLLLFTMLGLRLPDGLGVATFVLSVLWLIYWLAQALKLDVTGFTKFASDTASAAKNLGGLTGKSDDKADQPRS